ncbi:Tol-Pal system beta propeller repeat protein TolB [Geomonas sp.]|uniref:Tol-Pal system beta propeller repeat protein TolB n=1 Tax=Geomonas sp. TaxID=2651584 RepID=UPI002B49BE1E|nr:Tol-Pal system beta propeller repeat protein TolB [Geomonas sp.]HJV36924.1 Tol-Pal system beta propeller repeat protein TolB [Geomonas sp.]
MRRSLLCLLWMLLVLSTTYCRADNSDVITVPTSGKFQLTIAPSTVLSGAAAPELGQKLGELFSFDMGVSGLFEIAQGGGGSGLLLKSAYQVTGDSVVLECRLFDQILNRELTAKRYSGGKKDLRRMAHAFSDEVLRALTGQKGPFTGLIAYVSKVSGNKEIFVMDYDGYNPRRVTNNGSININPDFAPSGKEIIYTSYKKGNPDLYRRELYTGFEARISARSGLNAMGAYSPDGNRIAEVMSKDGNSEVYLISREGKELSRLTRDAAIDVSPAWSPDGSKIVFVSDRLGKPQLFVMNADGSNVRRLTTSGAYNVTPRWSPKGDRIVYARQEGGGFQIHAINPDGSGDTQLTSSGSNEHPRWSPDGRFIVFSSTRDGAEAIYLMRGDGSGQTRISRGKGSDSHPSWSQG